MSTTIVVTHGYLTTTQDMSRMRRAYLQRTALERWRRYMLMVLDAAIDQCERRNLAAPDGVHGTALAAPKLVADLIERLQLEQGQEVHRPRNNQEALDVLFDLQLAYMPNADKDNDPEAAA